MVQKVVVEGKKPSVENMNIDRHHYEQAQSFGPDEVLVRLYEWERASVSLGSSQSADLVRPECLNEVDVVKRITGGSAVLHHMEITYSIAAPYESLWFGGGLHQSYKTIALLLTKWLRSMGVQTLFSEQKNNPQQAQSTVCFQRSGYGEITFEGRKLIGSAQKRGRHAFLQHGSIPFHKTPKVLEDFLQPQFLPPQKTHYAYLEECLPGNQKPSLEEAKQKLADCFHKALQKP